MGSSDGKEPASDGVLSEAQPSPQVPSPTASAFSTPPARPERPPFTPLITVVGFHHARGPEVETWFGVQDGFDPAAEYGWNLLPFMALSDGAHA